MIRVLKRLRLLNDNAALNRSFLYTSLFILILLSGFYNSTSKSWTPFFRLNLFLHPLLGILVTALLVRSIFHRLRSRIPGLTYPIGISFVAIFFFSLLRAFTLRHLPIDQSNVIAGLIFFALFAVGIYFFARILPLLSFFSKNLSLWLDVATVSVWSLTASVGIVILIYGGGRDAKTFFDFHGFLGYLAAAVGFAALLLPVRSNLRNSGVVTAIPAAFFFFLVVSFVTNFVWNRLNPVPTAIPFEVHLSTTPYESRPPEERDPVPFPIDRRWIDISSSCAGQGCHPKILEDFQHSIHNLSCRPQYMKKNFRLLAEDIGGHNQIICAGCHMPTALFLNPLGVEGLCDRNNSSCVFCHSISHVAVDGPRNSRYTVTLPMQHLRDFVEAERDQKELDSFHRLMIKLNPKAHGRAFSRDFYKEDIYCQSCHHLQLSPSGRGPKCIQCHMEPRDVMGLQGKAKNHLFPGSNTTLHSLLGLENYSELIEKWMQGGFFIRILEDLYAQRGKKRPLEEGEERLKRFFYLTMSSKLDPPPRRGSRTELRIRTKNIGVDHAFPSGSLDLVETWLEVRVTDNTGRRIFSCGGQDDHQRLLPGTHTMGGYMIGLDGKVITRNTVWQVRKKVVQRRVEDQEETVDSFSFWIPQHCGDYLNIEAEWKYRKFNPDFWMWVYGEDRRIPSPSVVRYVTQYRISAGGDAQDSHLRSPSVQPSKLTSLISSE